MTSVWMVSQGEYSDYSVRGVFTTQEAAQAYVAANHGDQITEMELDPQFMRMPEGYQIYRVWLDKNGNWPPVDHPEPWHWWADKVYICDWVSPGASELHDVVIEHGDIMNTFVMARSPEHALKVAQDRRANILAAGLWAKELKKYRPIHVDVGRVDVQGVPEE